MGQALDSIKDKKGHQVFSKLLGEFAKNIDETIEKHNGSLIYAGGDDVMAYIPLYSAIECADEVRKAFEKSMDGIFTKLQLNKDKTPTFSIGLAIVHHSEPLDNALNIARKAEQIAKQEGGRNALAIIQHKRGGSDLTVCGKWSGKNNEVGLERRLQLMCDLHQNKILPSTLGYQLRQVRLEAGDNMQFEIHDNKMLTKNAAAALVKRIFLQKNHAKDLMAELHKILTTKKSIRQLSDEMVIARQFSEDQKIINKSVGETV